MHLISQATACVGLRRAATGVHAMCSVWSPRQMHNLAAASAWVSPADSIMWTVTYGSSSRAAADGNSLSEAKSLLCSWRLVPAMSNDLVSPDAMPSRRGPPHMLVNPLATYTLLSSWSPCLPLTGTLLWNL